MRLTKNTVAPTFKAKDIYDKEFNLLTNRDKVLIVSFFRYASCPLCNLRVHELTQNYSKLKNKFDIVLIFQSPTIKINKYVTKQDIPYVIIPDPDKYLYNLYKVESSWIAFIKAWTTKISRIFDAVFKHNFIPGSIEGEIHKVPADFIIDTDNKILKAYYGKDIGDHLALSEIYTFIENYETR